ncbi:MAG: superoxide dismutase [Candidatus Woesearchaeota archaeon]|jgi:Fe-Mn family superoxide dismutase
MENQKKYVLPELRYKYDELEPYISEEQLRLHHTKHHKSYVDKSNAIIESIDIERINEKEIDMKAVLKELSFNVSGHLLHSLFWKNISPISSISKKMPNAYLLKGIKEDFGSFERFKKEFTSTALSVEGSGWAVLALCQITKRLIIMQIEKHNVNIIPTFGILLVFDVFEHAYYVDYKNDRMKYIEALWNLTNWKEVERRFDSVSIYIDNMI